MDILTLLLIAVGLAMDVFAVSLGVGTSRFGKPLRTKLRLAFHFGLFQGGMTLLGWLAGTQITSWIAGFDHWVAFGLLTFIGIRMILSGANLNEESHLVDPSRGASLVMLSVATSLDALAIGLSLAFLDSNILIASIVIGAVSAMLSILGSVFGGTLGARFGKRMEILGGILLIGIGVRIVITHLVL